LPDIAEGSSSELNRGLTSIILVVISVLFMIDSHASMKHRDKQKSSSKVHSESEVQKHSSAADPGMPEYAVAISPSGDVTKKHQHPSVQQHHLSYSALLQLPEVLSNLLGEALHNLNDGIAIATAFTLSWASGGTRAPHVH
jgi:zinc transporter ZupT